MPTAPTFTFSTLIRMQVFQNQKYCKGENSLFFHPGIHNKCSAFDVTTGRQQQQEKCTFEHSVSPLECPTLTTIP